MRWKQTDELKASDTTYGDDFGFSVAISDGIAVVGGTGAAVFTNSAAGWKQTAELKGSGTVPGDAFGNSVAISGTTVAVGAYEASRYAGRVYLFTKKATGWKQIAKLKGSDTVANDLFGESVAISGTTALVGAPDHDRVYVFQS